MNAIAVAAVANTICFVVFISASRSIGKSPGLRGMACSKMAAPPFSNQGRIVVRGSSLLQLRIRSDAAHGARVVNESAAGRHPCLARIGCDSGNARVDIDGTIAIGVPSLHDQSGQENARARRAFGSLVA